MTYKPESDDVAPITEKTRVALSLRVLLPMVGTIVFGSAWGVLWLNQRFDALETQMNRINQTVKLGWSLQDQQLWVEDAKRFNNVSLPEPSGVFFHNRPFLIDPNAIRP